MENNFLKNLRTAQKVQFPYKVGKEPARLSAIPDFSSSNNTKKWDFDKINQVLRSREAKQDISENPLVDLNVDLPKTPAVLKIQSGKYKLYNDINTSGINDSNALYVVGNTYQENEDGTNYGMGWDGRPYSYTIKNNVVGNFKPLGIDEQYKAIERLSGGKVKAYDSIDSPGTLAEIYRSLKRMQEHGNGNLVPDEVNIGDPDPGAMLLGGGVQGWYDDNNQYSHMDYRPDEIALLGTSFPGFQSLKQKWSLESGHNSGSYKHLGDGIITHELAHAAESAYRFGDFRERQRDRAEADKYEGQYSAEDLIKQGLGTASTILGGAKYAIPILFDKIFGTHLVPTEEEYNEMPEGIASKFWADYIYPPDNSIKSIKEKKLDELYKRTNDWGNDMLHSDDHQGDLFKRAANNLGFKNTKEAIATISEYANTNYTEAFAEAYTDVLLNGTNAKPFSQELIRLYSEAADKYTDKYKGKKKSIQMEMLNKLIDVLPIDKVDLSKPDFIKSLRSIYDK